MTTAATGKNLAPRLFEPCDLVRTGRESDRLRVLPSGSVVRHPLETPRLISGVHRLVEK